MNERTPGRESKGFLDGDLIESFLDLRRDKMEEVCVLGHKSKRAMFDVGEDKTGWRRPYPFELHPLFCTLFNTSIWHTSKLSHITCCTGLSHMCR